MRDVQGEDEDRLLASMLVSASHPEEEKVSKPSSPRWALGNSTHHTGLMPYMALQGESVDNGEMFPRYNGRLKQSQRKCSL